MSRLVVLVRLVRFPGLLLAIVGATTVVAMVTVMGSLFLDAAASSTLAATSAADAVYRLPTAAITADTPVIADVVAYRSRSLDDALAPTLGSSIVTARGDLVLASTAGEDVEVRLVSRTDALAHVPIVEGSPGEGVWLADVTADLLGVGAGDELTLTAQDAGTTIQVAGVYGDLLDQPRTPFWGSLDDFIYPEPGANTRPPAFLLMDLDTYLEVDGALLDDQDPMTWEFLLPVDGISMQEAERLRGTLDGFSRTLTDQSTAEGSAFSTVGFTEPLSGWIDRSTEVTDQIGPPVRGLMIAVVVLALAVLAAAGAFLVRRRRTEYALLDARGVALPRIAARTVGEALLPVAAGAALGWVAGLLVVDRVTADAVVSERVLDDARRTVALVSLVALVLLAVVVARTATETSSVEAGGVRRVAARVPWEGLVLVLAVLAFMGLRGEDPGGAIDPLFLLFPVLVLAGVVGLAVRGLRRVLPWVRSFGTGWGTASYLAVRRLTAASRGALALLTVSAVAVGILIYAGTIATSVEAAAGEAASLTVGSDVAVSYSGTFTAPGNAVPVTDVGRVARSSLQGSETELDVLVVDPATFAGAAFWRDGFSERSLEDLMADLAGAPDPRAPVVLGGDLAAGSEPVLSIPGLDVPVRVVGTASAFPGQVGDRPVVVIARDTLAVAVGSQGFDLETFVGTTQVWGRGTEQAVRDATTAGGATPLTSVTAEALRDTPEYLAIVSMLRLLIAVGVVAGSVVFVVAALYLAARQRQAEVAYALSRRMGLTRPASRGSLLLEVSGLLAIALVLGSVVAVAASVLVYADTQARVVDATASTLRLPLGLLGVTAAALGGFALVATSIVQGLADRANVAEVMRGAR